MDVLALTKIQKKKFIHLPIKQAIYVPSTFGVEKQISRKDLVKRADDVSKFLTNLFGGYSSYDLHGGYLTKKSHKLIREHFVRVVAFSSRKDFKKKRLKLFEQIAFWAKKWKQEYVGYEYEEDLYYIPPKG